ncbi:MAG: DsbA family protein [Bacillota bacterium]|uniref:DsbA family protein n=1 Tax=Bacillus pumilus TaxID=1408 RepID=A0A2G8IXJ6_BACPU|nr:DsbA family protein [Bacillus pumilus]PIK28159.1 DsbA family protein [Bacillus pumilus]
MNDQEVSFIYVWDAYCGWCYGFSNSIRTLHEIHPEIPLTLVSGGLFVGDRSLPIKDYPHISEANQRISQLTGVEFGERYEELLANGTFLLDSEAAAIGFSALRSIAPERVLYLASSMQKSFYQEGKSLSDEETYREIAMAHHLDPDAVIERLKEKETINDAYADFAKVQQLNVNGYPTLLLKKGDEYFSLGGGAMTAEKLEGRLKEILEKIDQ